MAFSPYVTTNAKGTFGVSSFGYISGTLVDNAPDLFRIAGGVLDAGETLPMWGGIAISEEIPSAPGTPSVPGPELGGNIIRATANTVTNAAGSITGWCVFNQAHNYYNYPQSPVPRIAAGGTLNFVRLGSGARLVLPIDPALVSLDGSIITSQVTWDLTAQQIVAFATNALPIKILQVLAKGNMVPTYNSGTDVLDWNRDGSVAIVIV